MSLNSKKSWHPGKALNRAKVQKKEEDELAKKLELERRQETLKEEKELEKLRQANTSIVSNASSQTAWMYDSPNTNPAAVAKSTEIADILYGSAIEGTKHKPYQTGSEKSGLSEIDRARKRAADPLHKVLEMRRAKLNENIIRRDYRKINRLN